MRAKGKAGGNALSHFTERLVETKQCKGKEGGANSQKPEESFPCYIETCASKQNALSEFYKVSGGRKHHDVLHDFRHALTRCDSSREKLHGQ